MWFSCVMVREVLQCICGFSFDFTKSLVEITWNAYEFDWNATFSVMAKSLVSIRSFQGINFVALGAYGIVVVPIYDKFIAPMVVALFDQLLFTLAFNLGLTIVVKTMRSMQDVLLGLP